MTLSISDIKNYRIAYLASSGFCLVFALIYEYFSHGVYSRYMLLAFVIPLIGGLISELYTRVAIWRERHGNIANQLLGGGIIWMTLGSIANGILNIYGTTNHLVIIFGVVGLVHILASLVAFFWSLR